jgi:hypothetical protein
MHRHPDAELLASVTELMNDTRTFLEELNLIPRAYSPTDSILLALLSKSIVLTDAVVCLLSNGFTDEAMWLCRSCIEIELVVRYLTLKDTDKRCMRFLNYYSKDKTEWFRLNNKYFPESPLKQRADMKELLELASAYPSPHKWSDVPEGLKGMASEPDPTMKAEDGTPATALFSYEVTYKMASQYVHGTVGSLDPAHATSAGDYYRFTPGRDGQQWVTLLSAPHTCQWPSI